VIPLAPKLLYLGVIFRGDCALTRLLALLPVVALMACSSSSEVAELSPGIFGLTAHGNTPAQAARVGVERAQAHCAAMDRAFEVTRSHIGGRDYTIAFRCPRPDAAAMNPAALVQPPRGWEPAAPLPQAGGGTAGAVALY
jgi:hypothetical protein